MDNKIEHDYLNLVEFWNQNFALSDADKKAIKESLPTDDDLKSLAPSQKLFDVLSIFKGNDCVLDYGCGSGWASIILAKNGVNNVTAADVAPLSIEMTKCYAEAFKVRDKISAVCIDSNWIRKQQGEIFDGFYCSNVIDVVPFEMAKDIIKHSARVVRKGSLVVFSLNYYIDPLEMEKRGATIDGKSIYINGVLRLLSLKDEEWLEIFKEYYDIIELDYFAWPGEAKETRRIFVLKKR